MEEVSTVLGASTSKTIFSISFPIMRPALFSGLLNAFVRSMTSVSAVIFLLSANWNLSTVSILTEIESQRMSAASAYCVVLMLMVVLAITILELVVNRLFRIKR